MQIAASTPYPRNGFTMVELLLSMAVLSLIIIGLADLFVFTAKTWSGEMRRSAEVSNLDAAARLLRSDLESAFPNRPVTYPAFDSRSLTNEARRRFFANRILLPFEVDRRVGVGSERTFENADRSSRFSQIAFVAIQPGAGTLLPETFYPERHGHLADPSLPSGTKPSPSDACLIGYYVAYTPDSPMGDRDRWSMKLYRHFRPGGTSLGQAQASSTIRSLTTTINHELVPRLKFSNAELPFLLAFHATGPDSGVIAQTPSQVPWPSDLPELGQSLPDRSRAENWYHPNHPIHDVLPGDSAIASNVVGFSVTPYKRVLDGETMRILGAADLAKHLGFSGDEWPAMVVPDFIDIELAVLDETTAGRLTKREDWLVDWDGPPVASEPPSVNLIRRGVTSFCFRVCLRPLPPESSLSS